MKLFIKEYCRDVTVRIYGVDGDEHTKDFFDRYFYNTNCIGIVSEKMRKEYHSEAEYYLETAAAFQFLAQNIGKIQNSIDMAAFDIVMGKTPDEFCIDSKCYLI